MNELLNLNWKPVVGYEEFYEVSDSGLIRSKDRKSHNGTGFYIKKARLVKYAIKNTGYYQVGLNKDRKQQQFTVHRIVAAAFLPNPDNKTTVNHKDGNKLNNRVENLEWATQSENILHSFKTGMSKQAFKGKKRPPEVCAKIAKGQLGRIPWNKGKSVKPITHGVSGYHRGCRCQVCKSANTEYCKAAKSRTATQKIELQWTENILPLIGIK